MDMVFGNLHAKFGDHSSSSLVIIDAQTEISQTVAFLGQIIVSIVEKVGFFCQVRMDLVLGNLHEKIGAHSSSSLVIIAAQTEICQKMAFFPLFF